MQCVYLQRTQTMFGRTARGIVARHKAYSNTLEAKRFDGRPNARRGFPAAFGQTH
jgi:hypothetical protein